MTRLTNAVLLAAGRGTRMQLEGEEHKSLLPISGKPAISRIIDALLADGIGDIVVVLGHSARHVRRRLQAEYGDQLRFVYNRLYRRDTNILSTELGVAALGDPERGYLIVETDVALEPTAWGRVCAMPPDRSFWVTHGQYGPDLTGGALRLDAEGRVDDLVYQPQYRAEFDGYRKLIGILYVAPNQVETDRRLRNVCLAAGADQYYMTPWTTHLDLLECYCCDLTDLSAIAYNDRTAYARAGSLFAPLD